MKISRKAEPSRRRRTLLAGVVLALLATIGQTASATDEVEAGPQDIEYGSPDQSVWTIRTDEHGVPGNPLMHVAAALFAEAGTPWRARVYPAPRLFANLKDGTTPFSMLVRVPSLQECCLFSQRPITTVEIRAYHRPAAAPLSGTGDLAGKRVITIHGYSYGGLLKFITDERNRVTNNVAHTHAEAFRMLANGRADYVIDYADPAREVLTAEPIAGVRSTMLSQSPVYLVLSRNYPEASGFMARLESIAAKLDIEAMLGRTGGGVPSQ